MIAEYLDAMKPAINKELAAFQKDGLSPVWLEQKIGRISFTSSDEILSALNGPITEMLSRGGKRWRPVLMMLCSEAVGGNAHTNILACIPVIEYIHNGTLMIDDIEDNSQKRRGKPCIHHVFGTDVAINTGNMMYYLPSLILHDLNVSVEKKLAMHEAIAEEMLKLHLGQALDIYWRNGGNNISKEGYLQMCAYKTGALARLASRLGALLGNAPVATQHALAHFAESLGVAFQIQDDSLNITNTTWGKDFGEDITEGKRTLLVIRVLEIGSPIDRARLLEILNRKTTNPEELQEAIALLLKYNTLSYAQRVAKELVSKTWATLEKKLPETDAKQKLKEFAEYVVTRGT